MMTARSKLFPIGYIILSGHAVSVFEKSVAI